MSNSSRQFLDHDEQAAMPRSQTDSKINYLDENGAGGDESVDELQGSVFYVGPDGQMDYRVVLMAVHAVSGRAYTVRVCSVLLNIINCLVDIGVVVITNSQTPDSQITFQNGLPSAADDHTNSSFCLAVETVFR